MDSPSSPTETLLREAPFVHRLANALLRDPQRAHDVAQDVLTAALQTPPTQHVRGWLAAATRHLAGHARRKERLRSVREAQAARPEAGDDEKRTGDRLRLHRRLTDAVMALPEPYRTAVTLRYLDELSPRAIAVRLELPAETVRQHVHRGLAMLRGKLDKDFGEREAWHAAFAAVGLGRATVFPLAFFAVLAMKKFVAVALLILSLAVGAWWWSHLEEPLSQTVANATTSPTREKSVAQDPNAGTEANREVVALPVHPGQQRFSVVVTDERGQAIPQVAVHCWPDGGQATLCIAGDDGRVEFVASDAAGGILVRAPGRPPLLRQFSVLRGEQAAVLPDGCTVSGQLLVDGYPGASGLKMKLTGPRVDIPSTAPPEVGQLLEKSYSAVETVAGGLFSFVGLPKDWSGDLMLPEPLWLLPESGGFENQHESVTLDEPRHRLVLACTLMPTITGQLVWTDDAQPICNAEVLVDPSFDDPTTSASMSITTVTDEQGRFVVSLSPVWDASYALYCNPATRPATRNVKLRSCPAGSSSPAEITLEGEQLALRSPVTLRVSRAETKHFLAINEAGIPVQGARVGPSSALKPHGRRLSSTQAISAPTGVDGRGLFTFPASALLVGAPGYQVVPAVPKRLAAGTVSDPLVFTLSPGSTLNVHLRTPTGQPAEVAEMRIESVESAEPLFFCLFAGNRAQADLDLAFDCSEVEQIAEGVKCPTNAHGDYVLRSLEPNRRCRIKLLAIDDTCVLAHDMVTPAAGKKVVLDLVVTATPRRVAGMVCAQDGTPLEAYIYLYLDSYRPSTGSSPDGKFAFGAVYSPPRRITVTANGYAAQTREFLPGTGDAADLEFRLERGHQVTLRVLDELDSTVTLDVEDDDDLLLDLVARKTILGPGKVRYDDLPSGFATFACTLGGQRFEVRHDTANPDAILRVPNLGRIVVVPPSNASNPSDDEYFLYGKAIRTDLTGAEEFRVWLSEWVPPGRYRVVLALRGETLGPAVEVVVKSGEVVRVPLQNSKETHR